MRSPRAGGDSGAILVEFSLFLPFVVLIAMGLLEFGLIYSDTQIVGTALRSTARAGANTTGGGGDQATADWTALRAALTGLGELDLDRVNRIVIYDGSAGGSAPSACRSLDVSGTPFVGGVANTCNVYGTDWLTNTFDDTDSSVGFGSNGCPTSVTGWCPTTDRDSTAPGLDMFGVYVEYERDYITGLFGSTATIRDNAIYQIEPQAGS